MKKRQIISMVVALTVITSIIVLVIFLLANTEKPMPFSYSYIVVDVYPHDAKAFTQGLVFDNGVFYESTGEYGNSSLRQVKLETGEVLKFHALEPFYFGEGITLLDNKIIQLTWQSNKGFVYDKNSFELLQEFTYSFEGWGITYDGSHLIVSDGTSTLHFLDPETFEKTGQVEVYDQLLVDKLNELEYIQGTIYANILGEEQIAIINPQTGQVQGWINLTGLQNLENQNTQNVLNGIAYDKINDRLFVTGKRWPQLFEIKLVSQEQNLFPLKVCCCLQQQVLFMIKRFFRFASTRNQLRYCVFVVSFEAL